VRTLPLKGDAIDVMTDAHRTAWAGDMRLTAGETLAALAHPQATVTVDVKLVGFDGDG
jgi:hypothetical protein